MEVSVSQCCIRWNSMCCRKKRVTIGGRVNGEDEQALFKHAAEHTTLW